MQFNGEGWIIAITKQHQDVETTHFSLNSTLRRKDLEQGWAAPVDLREQSSVFRVVTRFLYFFLLSNMKDWCVLENL